MTMQFTFFSEQYKNYISIQQNRKRALPKHEPEDKVVTGANTD